MTTVVKTVLSVTHRFGFKTFIGTFFFVMALTLAEKIEIIGLAKNRTQQEAADIFNRNHPNRTHPLHRVTVARLFKKLRTHGDLNRKKRTKSHQANILEMALKDEVLECFQENPHLSTRKAARRLGYSNGKICKILKELKFHPYKKSKHQKLEPGDPPRRKQFCDQLLRIFASDQNYQPKILWTDEKPFYMNGCFNRQNHR